MTEEMRTNEVSIEIMDKKRYVFGECRTDLKTYAPILAKIGARCGVYVTARKNEGIKIITIVTDQENSGKVTDAGFDIINESEVGGNGDEAAAEVRDTIILRLFISLWAAEMAGVDFALSSSFVIPHVSFIDDGEPGSKVPSSGKGIKNKGWFGTMEIHAWNRYLLPRLKAWHYITEKSPGVPHMKKAPDDNVVTIGTGAKCSVEEGKPFPGMGRETLIVSSEEEKKQTKMLWLERFLMSFPEKMAERGVDVTLERVKTEVIVRKNPNKSPAKREERERLGAFIPPVRIENLLPDTVVFEKKTMTASEVEEVLKENLSHVMANTYTGKMDKDRISELDGEEISPRSSADNSRPYNPEKERIALFRSDEHGGTIKAYGEKFTWNEGYGRPLVIGDGGITIRLIEDTDSEGYASAMDVQHVTADAAIDYSATRKIVQELIIRNMIMKGIPLMEGDGKFRYFFHPHDAKNSSTKEFEMTISGGRMEIHQIKHKSKSENDRWNGPSSDLIGSICLDGKSWHKLWHTDILFIPETENIEDQKEKWKKVKETFTGFRYFREGGQTYYCAGKGKGSYHRNVAVFPNIYRTDLPPETIESMLSTYAIRLNDETSLPWQFAFIRRYAESLEEHNVPQEKKEEDKEKKEKKRK